MKRIVLVLIIVNFASLHYGQILADHTVVEEYDQIPQQYIDAVKSMLVWIPGMSHGYGYLRGAELLEVYDSRFQVLTFTNDPIPAESNSQLRLGRPYMTNEAGWYTSQAGINSFMAQIASQNATGNQWDVIGFGWSYQGTWTNPAGGTIDPVYNVRWAGSSDGGPEGDRRWGLDSEDFVLTGNSVCMDTYLDATEQYIAYCAANNFETQIIFTNGCVDDNAGTELGFQRELKNKHIRDYIAGKSTKILFDYADILVHNNAGELYTADWNDGGNIRPHQQIHPDNMMDYDGSFNIIPPGSDAIEDHIGEVGTLRLAKALWWMLARIAGWDGTNGGPDDTPPSVPDGLTINSATETSISFEWNASTDNVGVTGYNIFRDGAFLETASELTYTDNSVGSCTEYTYTISAIDAAGNESPKSTVLVVNNCAPDLTSTITLSPNVAHGVTIFNLIIRVTELNGMNTSGAITIHIPKDQLWGLSESYDPSLTILGGTSLDNSEWAYSEDGTNHIFSSSNTIIAGGSSTLGFRISFNPGSSMGTNPITSQVVSGGGGEVQVSNNSDSERLDYFQN